MTRYWLNEGIYSARLGEVVVFLNMRSGRYQAWLNSTQSVLEPFPAGDAREPSLIQGFDYKGTSAEALDELVAEGLLTREHQTPRHTGIGERVTEGISPGELPRISKWMQVVLFIRFVAAWSTSTLLFRVSGLATSIAHFQRRKRAAVRKRRAPSGLEPHTLMMYFYRLRTLFYSADGNCVKDSLILADFLLRNGHLPTLVIAVCTRPFGGHCWVQSGNTVLNDSPDRVAAHTPLLFA